MASCDSGDCGSGSKPHPSPPTKMGYHLQIRPLYPLRSEFWEQVSKGVITDIEYVDLPTPFMPKKINIDLQEQH